MFVTQLVLDEFRVPAIFYEVGGIGASQRVQIQSAWHFRRGGRVRTVSASQSKPTEGEIIGARPVGSSVSGGRTRFRIPVPWLFLIIGNAIRTIIPARKNPLTAPIRKADLVRMALVSRSRAS